MRARWIVAVLVCASCTYDYDALRHGTGDGGPPPPDVGPRCHSDMECSDHTWCNGDEACKPLEMGADAMGCVPGIARCALTMACMEADQRCGSGCVDMDGDGYEATHCGGDDCDDSDPRRNPGAMEVCDTAGLDEDCNAATFGFQDADNDTYPNAMCCNGDHCGSDCNDNNPAINPAAVEVCDGVDNNCNGQIDEGVQSTYYRDMDGDGYGAPAPTILGCSPPPGYAVDASDCNDNTASVHPGAHEACNSIDDDCNGLVDDSCS